MCLCKQVWAVMSYMNISKANVSGVVCIDHTKAGDPSDLIADSGSCEYISSNMAMFRFSNILHLYVEW